MLSNLQKNFITAVREEKDELLITEIAENGFAPRALIDVYRNNTFSVQKNALAITYAALANILGEKFSSLAFHYIRNNPSRSGNLDDYGHDFPEFLETLEFFDKNPELIELSIFEKLYQESSLAAQGKIFNSAALAGIKPEDMMNLKFEFAPHVRLFAAKFPVFKLWNNNIERKGDEVSLDNRGDFVLFTRPRLKPEIYLLDKAQYLFLDKLYTGSTLYDAFNEAIGAEENFNLEEVIKNNIIRGVFTDFK